MAPGKNSRGGEGRSSSSYCSTVPVAVFVAFGIVGIWIAMSSIVTVQDSVMEVPETINEVKNIANQTGSRQFEDRLGDIPPEESPRDSQTPRPQSESHSESAEAETPNGQIDDNQLRGSTKNLDKSKSDKSLDDSKLGTENSVGEVTQQDETFGESMEEEIKKNLDSETNQSTGDSNVKSHETSKEEEASSESQKPSISIDSNKYDLKLQLRDQSTSLV